jgi:hypothetical protein
VNAVKKNVRAYRFSFYNEQRICLACSDKEAERSDWKLCREAEMEAVKRGDLNFHYKTPAEMEASQ